MLVFTAIVIAVLSSSAQNSTGAGQAAFEAFHKNDYATALNQAQALLATDEGRVDALFVCGESAYSLGYLPMAERYFQEIPDSAKTGLYAITDLRLAAIKSGLGKCAAAEAFLKKYLLMCRDTNDLFVRQVQLEIEECQLVIKKDTKQAALAQPHQAPAEKATMKSSLVEVRPLAANINTPAAELAPVRYADKMYFTSTSLTGKNGRPVSRLYTAIRDEKAVPLEVNPREESMQAAHTALTANAGRIYYSQYKEERGSDLQLWELWFRDRNYDGTWGPPKRLPRAVNMPGFAASQPATGFDLNLKKELLFFASDRPGGQGKWDIWACTVEQDEVFGEPFCLSFNTPDDEVAPYFLGIGQTLYFSSNSAGGIGGYDIYKTSKSAAGEWAAPINLETPVNSPNDELYFTFHNGSNLYYFSSNRPGKDCKTPGQPCNFDIYSAHMNVGLNVLIFNQLDSTSLDGANVELMDLATGHIDTSCVRLQGNHSTLILTPGKNYRLIISKEDYFPLFKEINTVRAGIDARLEERIFLKSMKTPEPALPASGY